MIKIKKIYTAVNGENCKLSSKLDIDGQSFELCVNIVGEEYHKYAVVDRADAFLFGVLPYAMRHSHDIICEQPVSGELLFNLNSQLIPTLSKYDEHLYNTMIHAEIIESEIPCEDGVGTGISCGVDCLYTVIENMNYCGEKLKLTHFFSFNEGAFGGSYYKNNRAFSVVNMQARSRMLADELNLPIVRLSTNLESLMRVPYDQFVVYAMGMMIISVSKMIKTYMFSSSAGDYADFNVKNSSKKDTSYYDALTLHCISYGNRYFYSAGGSKTRFEKIEAIVDNPITKKYLHSCLTHDFNCGICPKCYRNLLTLDALEKLDEYESIYDIEAYKHSRKDALNYLVREISFHGYSYPYLLDIYNVIKKREPNTIKSIEQNLSIDKVLSERDYLKNHAVKLRKCIRAYKTLLSSDEQIKRVKEFFEVNNIHNVILYYYSYCTDLLLAIHQKIGITIDYIVEDVTEKRMIPRLPIDTVDYPKCDAIIICDMDHPNIIKKKLEARTNNRLIFADEFLDLRDHL